MLGFTKLNADEFEDMVSGKWLIPDGYGIKYWGSDWWLVLKMEMVIELGGFLEDSSADCSWVAKKKMH